MNLNDYLMPVHDAIVFYGSIVAIILNLGSFLLMHFVPSKKRDPFKFLMKWGRFADTFVPFTMGVMTEARILPGYCGLVTRGLCGSFRSPWCARINLVISIILNDVLFGMIVVTSLMRYNVFIRKTTLFKTTLRDKILIFIIIVASPVALLATSSDLIVVDDNFIHAGRQQKEEFDFYRQSNFTVLIVSLHPLNSYSYAMIFFAISLIDAFLFGVFCLYVPLELSLWRAASESNVNTAEKVKNSIYFLRFQNLIPTIAFIILTISVVCAFIQIESIFHGFNSIAIAVVLIYFYVTPFFTLYHYYKHDFKFGCLKQNNFKFPSIN